MFRPDGQPDGYDVDIGKALAAALKVKPEFILVDSPGRITALQTGKADVADASFTNTIERSTAIAFTRPYLIVGSIVCMEAAMWFRRTALLALLAFAIPAAASAQPSRILADVLPAAETASLRTPHRTLARPRLAIHDAAHQACPSIV